MLTATAQAKDSFPFQYTNITYIFSCVVVVDLLAVRASILNKPWHGRRAARYGTELVGCGRNVNGAYNHDMHLDVNELCDKADTDPRRF